MTASDDHDEYAAAAAKPPQGDTVKPYYKATVTFVLTYVSALVIQEQGVDVSALTGGDWARAAGAALVTTVGMFYTKYQTTKPSA